MEQVKQFGRELRAEVIQIVWPQLSEVLRVSFLVVLVLLGICTLILFADELFVDLLLGKLFHFLG
jgi:preprotein translocase SecE subunit